MAAVEAGYVVAAVVIAGAAVTHERNMGLSPPVGRATTEGGTVGSADII